MRKSLLPLLIGALCLIAAFIFVAYLWDQAGMHLSLHGWIAYGLGCTASMALSAGLFFLTFKSSRDGFDDNQTPKHYDE